MILKVASPVRIPKFPNNVEQNVLRILWDRSNPVTLTQRTLTLFIQILENGLLWESPNAYLRQVVTTCQDAIERFEQIA